MYETALYFNVKNMFKKFRKYNGKYKYKRFVSRQPPHEDSEPPENNTMTTKGSHDSHDKHLQ